MFIIRSIRSRLPNVRGKVREVEIGMKEATRAAHTHLNDGCGRRLIVPNQLVDAGKL